MSKKITNKLKKMKNYSKAMPAKKAGPKKVVKKKAKVTKKK